MADQCVPKHKVISRMRQKRPTAVSEIEAGSTSVSIPGRSSYPLYCKMLQDTVGAVILQNLRCISGVLAVRDADLLDASMPAGVYHTFQSLETVAWFTLGNIFSAKFCAILFSCKILQYFVRTSETWFFPYSD